MPSPGARAVQPTIAELSADPHPSLAALRRSGPICWVSALGGWVVTGHALAVTVMRDAETFTVDDPRFTTSQVIGRSMLSADGADHSRHRQPFVSPFSLASTRERFGEVVDATVRELVDAIRPTGAAELRRSVAAPLAVASMAAALGLASVPVDDLLGWYAAIVAAVSDVTAGAAVPESGRLAYAGLAAAIEAVMLGGGSSLLADVASRAGVLSVDETLSNAAVLLFGGIETTEAMIANVVHHLLSTPTALDAVRADPEVVDAVIEESLRMEPAAAEVDRYATRPVTLGGVDIDAGDLVVVSLAGANRDPAVFDDPDRFDPGRANLRRHLAFAQGPHTCLGIHLARLEARAAVTALLGLPGLRHDAARSTPPEGLVFRKPAAVWGTWTI